MSGSYKLKVTSKEVKNDITETEFVVVCPNCHTPIKKGDVYCRQCNKLLVRQIFGDEK